MAAVASDTDAELRHLDGIAGREVHVHRRVPAKVPDPLVVDLRRDVDPGGDGGLARIGNNARWQSRIPFIGGSQHQCIAGRTAGRIAGPPRREAVPRPVRNSIR